MIVYQCHTILSIHQLGARFMPNQIMMRLNAYKGNEIDCTISQHGENFTSVEDHYL